MTPSVSVSALRMRALALELPRQLSTGYQLGRDLETRSSRETHSAALIGMGGSAIAGDLLQCLTDPETDLALSVVRGPGVPRAVGRRTVVVLASYSGNTWETLAAYDEAGRRDAHRIALSSGGELARRSERDRVAHLQLPPGLPPRSAVGYMLGGLLGIFDPFFPESNEARLKSCVEALTARQIEFASGQGAPAQLARRVGARSPEIYSPVEIAAVARRWKTQVEENAKRAAHFDAIPELLHNALVAWDAIPLSVGARSAVIVLERAQGTAMVRAATTYLVNLLRRRRVQAERVVLNAEDRFEAIMTGVSYGDHFSLSLAENATVDPLEVRAIDRLKRAMGPG